MVHDEDDVNHFLEVAHHEVDQVGGKTDVALEFVDSVLVVVVFMDVVD